MSTTETKVRHTKWAIEVEEDAKYPGNFRLYAQSPVVPARFHIGTALGAAVPVVSIEEAKGNATLWASAADMLEALELSKDILADIHRLYGEQMEGTGSEGMIREHIELLTALVAKAKGGAA